MKGEGLSMLIGSGSLVRRKRLPRRKIQIDSKRYDHGFEHSFVLDSSLGAEVDVVEYRKRIFHVRDCDRGERY